MKAKTSIKGQKGMYVKQFSKRMFVKELQRC